MDAPQDTQSRPKNPREMAKFWSDEVTQSRKMLEKCHKQGTRIVKRFLDDRGFDDSADTFADGRSSGQFRLNLFNSNVTTLQDMLYSSLPRVEVNRTNADAGDDAARVAGVMIERVVNLDIDDNGESYDAILRSALQDRLLPGLGCARVRYEVETQMVDVPPQMDPTGQVEIAPGYQTEQVVWEDAPVEYYHWQDVLWGWARNFSEIPWIGYRSYLSKDEVVERFGDKFKDEVTYKTQKEYEDESDSAKQDDSPWKKAEIWEIWDKEKKQVVWWSAGASTLLDKRPDPLQLRQFFPSPPFLLANATTSLYRPVADFHIAQDLYNEVDTLQSRIAIITQAVKVVGVYSSSDDGIKRMMKEGFDNDLIPVDDWAMFAEQGGIKGAIDWLPIEAVVAALSQLIALRDQTIVLLQNITGMADVMQGGLNNQYEGVGQTQIKAQFGSVKIQALQDQFAEFTGNLLQLKAEVICRHFQPETIVKRANMQFSPDAQLIQPAVQLLKDPEMARVRLKVRPESISMIDYAKLKQDRTEWLNAFSTFMQSAAPMLEKEPQSLPVMLEMLQWTMAGFRGSNEIEGVLDRAVDQAKAKAEQAAQNPQQDPEAAKAAADAQAAQQKLAGELQKIQAKSQADLQMRRADMEADIMTTREQTQAKLKEIMANHQANMAEIKAKMEADVIKEQVQNQGNIQQTQATVEGEIQKDVVTSQLSVEEELQKARIRIDEETEKTGLSIAQGDAQLESKIVEMQAQSALTPDEKEDDDDE